MPDVLLRGQEAGTEKPARSRGCGDTRVRSSVFPGRRAAFAHGHPNSRPPRGTHLARGGGGGTSRFPDAGASPLSCCLAPGRPGASDGPRASWARRLGVRAGWLQPCAGRKPAPRPAPPGADGLPALAPPARAGTGAGTRVREGNARRKGATASWNTFPCLERKRSEERERGKKIQLEPHGCLLPQPLPRSLAVPSFPPSLPRSVWG